ncbi:hypothetical protein LMH87_009899 [Akanthomyces muscarius]|uniref:Uncharacterized protein n=1 Tax=Akanthomyces muscarius TaxID=2231603 RepID=A0A9W8QEW3_AKAMU|nr:hypothetical protein LMH87_009899 [Akanthomyces muscarius]KAJ4153411.1 hypothetical protein LMH87_009899 [Akanthomyces muscarius]
MAQQDLPSYQEVVTGDHPGSGHLQTLVLNGRNIVASENTECVLYELNSAPCEAMAHTYSITKVGSRPTSTARQGRASQRRHHLYDFSKKRAFSLKDLSSRVAIEGKASREASYSDVTLAGGLSGWTACTAKGHFAGQVSIRDRLKKFDGIVWTSDDGLIVALETRPTMGEDGVLDGQAQLNIHEALPAKDLDLLVACWMARLWMESKASLEAGQPRSAGSVFNRLWRQQPNIAKLGGSTSTQYAS